MTTTDVQHTGAPARPHPSGLRLRLLLLARAAALGVTSFVGVALLPLWLTLIALAPLTIIAWAVLPATALVRAYADANRRAAATMLDTDIRSPYRATAGPWLSRVWTIARDPASWRDALWMVVHAIVGVTLSLCQVVFFLGGLFYLAYPLLYALTPQDVFGHVFGGVDLHGVGQAALMMPLAVVSLGLWWATAFPFSRAEAAVTRALLR